MSKGFLLISRKLGQAVRVLLPSGDEVFIRFHEYDGRWAKLAIRAPSNCKITKVEGVGNVPVESPASPGRGRTSGGESSGDDGAGELDKN